jgi:hypothetical protein
MHLDDIAEWLRVLECQHIVLVHVSRRTDMQYARNRIAQLAGSKNMEKVLFLMDYRANKARYEQQMIAAGVPLDQINPKKAPARGPRPGGYSGASHGAPAGKAAAAPAAPAAPAADEDEE